MHKPTDSPISEVPGVEQGFLSKEFALLNRYVMQKLLVAALRATVYHRHLAEKVLNCHKEFRGRRCENGHSWAAPDQFRNSCSVRLCPHCAHRKAKIQASRVQKFTVGRPGLRYVVLSERNSRDLTAGIRSLYRGWNSLRRSVRWNGKVRGMIAVLEVTFNKRDRTWHPHLNVLFEGDYFPFEELRQAWAKATEGRGRSVHIQAANAGTAFELIKYTLKIAELKDSPDGDGKVYELLVTDPAALDEFLSAVYGLRIVRTYGTFRGIAVDEEKTEGEACPDCGSTCWVDVGMVHRDQLSFDFGKKVFRVVRAPSKRARALHLVRNVPREVFSTNPESIALAVEGRKRARHYERSVSGLFYQGAA